MDTDFKRSVVRRYSTLPMIALIWGVAVLPLLYRPVAQGPTAAAMGTQWIHWLAFITGPATLYIIIRSYRGELLQALQAGTWQKRLGGVAVALAVIVPWSLFALWQMCYASMFFGWFPIQNNGLAAHYVAAKFVWANFFWPLVSGFGDLFPLGADLEHQNLYSSSIAALCRLSSTIVFGSVTLPALVSARA